VVIRTVSQGASKRHVMRMKTASPACKLAPQKVSKIRCRDMAKGWFGPGYLRRLGLGRFLRMAQRLSQGPHLRRGPDFPNSDIPCPGDSWEWLLAASSGKSVTGGRGVREFFRVFGGRGLFSDHKKRLRQASPLPPTY